MKYSVLFVLLLVITSACGLNKQKTTDSSPLSITIDARRPIDNISDFNTLSNYAFQNSYDLESTALQPGMKVLFSASYGADGAEEGQSSGELVRGANGDLYYKQLENVTMQLLLPPGLGWDNSGSGEGASLWNISKYHRLINNIAFSNGLTKQNGQIKENKVYKTVNANEVDFTGGTANQTFNYKNALELKLNKGNPDGSDSDITFYFVKNIGPVAFDFRETGMVGGSVKVFLGPNQ